MASPKEVPTDDLGMISVSKADLASGFRVFESIIELHAHVRFDTPADQAKADEAVNLGRKTLAALRRRMLFQPKLN